MYCINCGKEIKDKANACHNCGTIVGDQKKDFFSYDYFNITVPKNTEYEKIDAYEALGWQMVEIKEQIPSNIVVTFRRNRKIQNKEHLNRIQVRLEDAFNSIKYLENSKTSAATAASLSLGITGTLIMGGGMSMVLLLGSNLLYMILGIIIALVGITVLSPAYLVFKKISNAKSVEMDKEIEKKRDEIDVLLEETSKFLN